MRSIAALSVGASSFPLTSLPPVSRPWNCQLRVVVATAPGGHQMLRPALARLLRSRRVTRRSKVSGSCTFSIAAS